MGQITDTAMIIDFEGIMQKRLLGTLLCCTGLFSFAHAADMPAYEPAPVAVVPAADLPAVSGINGKIDLFGGYTWSDLGDEDDDDDDSDSEFWGGTGSFSVPLGPLFGFQADGLLASSDGDAVWGVGGHLFWREPTKGLLGLYAGYTRFEEYDSDVTQVAAEGEAYFGRFSVEALLGYEFYNLDDDFDFDDDDGDDDGSIFGGLDLAFYATDNLRVSAGYRYQAERSMGVVGAEYMLPVNSFAAPAIFAEGRVGEDDYAAVLGGVRLYFGEQKSLIRRHREDDPRNHLVDTVVPVADGCTAGKIVAPPPPGNFEGPQSAPILYDECGNEVPYN